MKYGARNVIKGTVTEIKDVGLMSLVKCDVTAPAKMASVITTESTESLDLKPGDEVLFWNRLKGTTTDVMINYGDNSSWEIIQTESRHSFRDAGSYVVTLKSTGPGNVPVTLKMEVIVENR